MENASDGPSGDPPRGSPGDPLLTLEPLMEAVREGLEEAGWELSGVQKTTSHRYEGRWEGEASRSAYLFFHRADLPDAVGLDVFLDETTGGLRGNLALVVQGPPLRAVDSVPDSLGRLATAAGSALPEGYRTPLTLRLRLAGPDTAVPDAGTEVRFKLHLPETALEVGGGAVSTLARVTASAFDELLAGPEVRDLLR